MRKLLALTTAALLAGCGGGLWIGVGAGAGDDHPDVALAASPTSVRSGETVQLVAAASDDFGVDRVSFFRLESTGGATLLGTDDVSPYQIDVVVTGAANANVQFFARAVDDVDQASDSAPVTVTLLP